MIIIKFKNLFVINIMVVLFSAMVFFYNYNNYKLSNISTEKYYSLLNSETDFSKVIKVTKLKLNTDNKDIVFDMFLSKIFNKNQELNALVQNYKSFNPSTQIGKAIVNEGKLYYSELKSLEGEHYYFAIDYERILKDFRTRISEEFIFLLNIWNKETQQPVFDFETNDVDMKTAIERLNLIEEFLNKDDLYNKEQLEYIRNFYIDIILGLQHFTHLDENDRYKEEYVEIFEQILKGEIEVKLELIIDTIKELKERDYTLSLAERFDLLDKMQERMSKDDIE